jgi:hypothetical protein
MEINATDPQSGIYGIKIDEISGFGSTGNEEITIRFDICNVENPQHYFRIAFKAGPCLDISTNQVTTNISAIQNTDNNKVNLLVYPNPVTSKVTFDFSVSNTIPVNIYLYDMSGNIFQQICNQTAEKGVKYTISTPINKNTNQIFFYKLVAGDQSLEGKLLKIQ